MSHPAPGLNGAPPQDDPLAGIALFRSLDAGPRRAVADLARPRRYGPGSILFHEGDAAEGFHVLLQGRVKLFHLRPDGRESVLHVIQPGRLAGETAFGGGIHPFGAAALDETRSLYFSMEAFKRCVLAHPVLSLELAAALALRLRMFARKLQARDTGDAVRRVALYLLHRRRLADADAVDLDVSREMLAAMLGLARETLSRSLARLAGEGLIRLEGRRVFFPDLPRLDALARDAATRGL